MKGPDTKDHRVYGAISREVSRMGESREREGRLVIARGWAGMENEEWQLMGMGFPSDGEEMFGIKQLCTTLRTYEEPL